MTDITINIKISSEHIEPEVTTATDNMAAIVAKIKSRKVEIPKTDIKEEPIQENESAKKEAPATINMIDKERAIMGAEE